MRRLSAKTCVGLATAAACTPCAATLSFSNRRRQCTNSSTTPPSSTSTPTVPHPPPPAADVSVKQKAPPSRERLDAAKDIAKYLASERNALDLVEKLNADRRRYVLVAFAAREWFGDAHVKKELKEADSDKDTRIGRKDYNAWMSGASARRSDGRKPSDGSPSPSASSSAPNETNDVGYIPTATLVRVAIFTGVPFVAFGFLDNSVMILSGDAIGNTVGEYFNLSVMAAAALGGVVSGTCGIQIHGVAEKLIGYLGLTEPVLTAEQRRHSRYFMATHWGGTFGMMSGLLLGMFPLLFVSYGS